MSNLKVILLIGLLPSILCNIKEPVPWGLEYFTETSETLDDGSTGANRVCMNPSDSANSVGFILYKKFIGHLFMRDKLKYDESRNVYKRAISFTILPEQLRSLETLDDPRDLDTVLTEIFLKSHSFSDESHHRFKMKEFFVDNAKYLIESLGNTQVQFLLLACGVLSLAWYLFRRYRFGIISMIICGLLISGYIFSYLECNKSLQAKKMIKVLEVINESDNSSWWKSIKEFCGFKTNDMDTIKSNIQRDSTIELNYCRPDEVFMNYANYIFFKQLELIVGKTFSTFTALKENLTFPLNYMADFILVLLIVYIIKLTFKYILSPNAWSGLLYARNRHRDKRGSTDEAVKDRISGKNLEVLLHTLKEVINTTDEKQKSTNMIKVSGVQEVEEAQATRSKENPLSNQIDSINNNKDGQTS